MSLKLFLITVLRKILPSVLKRKALTLFIAVSHDNGDRLSAGQTINPAETENSSPGVQVIRTIGELDEKLKDLEQARQVSDDKLREGFDRFRMEFDQDVPSDPWSPEYREYQFALYEKIAGKPYHVANERSTFDPETAVNTPFPYYTQSCKTVGEYFLAIGHLVKVLDIPPGARILEFGPGWGNTTEILARMGHSVTAVDIEPNFIDLIRRRARKFNLDVHTVCHDFSYIETVEQPYDVILFFECFHHCSDHIRLISNFDRVLTGNGKVVFAAEPITDSFPIPWGLRMDGGALWAIRENGWLELGFREDYFVPTLERFGWVVRKEVCNHIPWATVFIASRNKGMEECGAET